MDIIEVKDLKASIDNALSGKDSFIIYDTETTGLHKQNDRIVQFSAVRVSVPEFKETDNIDIYIKIPFAMPEAAAAVNGITDELLEEKGLNEFVAFTKIAEFIHPDDVISGYNNLRFDDQFMDESFKRLGRKFLRETSFDIYQAVKKVVPAEDMTDPGAKRPSYTLARVLKYYNPEGEYAFHSSIEDVRATLEVFKFCYENMTDVLAKYEEKKKNEDEGLFFSMPREKSVAKVYDVWAFDKNPTMPRVYCKTSEGMYYYDVIGRDWREKPGCGNIEAINVPALREECLRITGARDNDEMFRILVKKQNERRKQWSKT